MPLLRADVAADKLPVLYYSLVEAVPYYSCSMIDCWALYTSHGPVHWSWLLAGIPWLSVPPLLLLHHHRPEWL